MKDLFQKGNQIMSTEENLDELNSMEEILVNVHEVLVLNIVKMNCYTSFKDSTKTKQNKP
jgi:hypothetical protein